MVSQMICHVEGLLSVRFITKLLSKEDLSVLDIFFHASLNIKICIYNASCAIQWSHRFVYTPFDSFVNLSINWPINTLLIENLTFSMYEKTLIESYKHFRNDFTGC